MHVLDFFSFLWSPVGCVWVMAWLAVVMTGSLCSLAILHRWTHSRTMRYWEIKYRGRKQNQCNVRRESWLWLKAAQAIPQLTVSSSLCKLWRCGVGWSKQFYGMLKQWREDWYEDEEELKNMTNLFIHLQYSTVEEEDHSGKNWTVEVNVSNWERESVRALEREREEERGRESCAAVASHSRRLRTAGVCVTALLKRGGGRGWACLQTLQGHRGTRSGRASAAPHQVEVPGPSPRWPPPSDQDTLSPPRPPLPTPWHRRPNISARTRI